ncbi:hypothetical protein MLD38_022722 [Melastoma candidum]|uniref:Uncharacterized protein n=1 Tax=Melastoma candidum TaxID=119954 RepID=A0ACB9QKT7_9MYRT|nr:hypothetical protein MLD38_022722 [Melastoma candidum]
MATAKGEEAAAAAKDGYKEAEEEEMAPWEQHASVINLPRFDYAAPASLLRRSHSGFLITCPFMREKSATKEAMTILEKYCGVLHAEENNDLDQADECPATKRRKLCPEESGKYPSDGTDSEHLSVEDAGNTNADANKPREDTAIIPETRDGCPKKDSSLSLVKLKRSGLLLFTISKEDPPNVVDAVSEIFKCLESGSLGSPLWCHRIFPIQATCNLIEQDLRMVVQKLVIQFLDDKRNSLARPVKFAVGYNRRGLEEDGMKNSGEKGEDGDSFPLLDRSKCFGAVASAVKDAVSDSIVDLKNPEIAILVDLLPLSAVVPGRSLVAAVSVLPRSLVTTKPRLCVKALVTEAKT